MSAVRGKRSPSLTTASSNGGAISALVSALMAAGMPEEMALRFGGAVHKGDALVITEAVMSAAPRSV